MAKKIVSKKKSKRTVEKGRVYVQSTFNNTVITLTDESGNVLGWATSGSSGFKGTRKSTSFAATVAAEHAAEKAKAWGLVQAQAFVKGIGSGRESAVRALQAAGIRITSIKDVTPIPHNGVRPRKPKRN